MNQFPWQGKISNTAQVGGIETSTLDNGPARGCRVAWFNTGSGLRFKVIIDRGLDIADAFYNQYSLAWLSHVGVTAPTRSAQPGLEWLRSFGGGMLTTCGFTHVGGPEENDAGSLGLHDEASGLAAELESVVQPDLAAGRLEMSITGTTKQTRVFGPSLECKRTIKATLGSSTISVHDVVINRGNTAAPHMLLYHCNFGWPLVDVGTTIHWRGELQPGRSANDKDFVEQRLRLCPPPMASHAGMGESVVFIKPDPSPSGECTGGLYNRQLGLALSLGFKQAQLPWLINWQHFGMNEYVTALEPATHPPIGQAAAAADGTLTRLEPGESRVYELQISVLRAESEIEAFLAACR